SLIMDCHHEAPYAASLLTVLRLHKVAPEILWSEHISDMISCLLTSRRKVKIEVQSHGIYRSFRKCLKALHEEIANSDRRLLNSCDGESVTVHLQLPPWYLERHNFGMDDVDLDSFKVAAKSNLLIPYPF